MDLVRTFFNIQTSVHKSGKVLKKKPSLMSAFLNIYREGGFFGLYKGLFISCLGLTPLLAIKLSIFDWTTMKLNVTKDDKFFDVWNSIIGAFSGICAVGAMYPGDVIKRFMQVKGLDTSGFESKGLLGCIKGMYKRNGILGFYRV